MKCEVIISIASGEKFRTAMYELISELSKDNYLKLIERTPSKKYEVSLDDRFENIFEELSKMGCFSFRVLKRDNERINWE